MKSKKKAELGLSIGGWSYLKFLGTWCFQGEREIFYRVEFPPFEFKDLVSNDRTVSPASEGWAACWAKLWNFIALGSTDQRDEIVSVVVFLVFQHTLRLRALWSPQAGTELLVSANEYPASCKITCRSIAIFFVAVCVAAIFFVSESAFRLLSLALNLPLVLSQVLASRITLQLAYFGARLAWKVRPQYHDFLYCLAKSKLVETLTNFACIPQTITN